MKRSTNGRVGWVRRNAGLITESMHPLEKSAPIFKSTSIHRLLLGYVNLHNLPLPIRGSEGAGRRKEATEAVGGVDPDVVEAAALVHDLGHPPFGHAVEKELDKLVKDEGI